MWYAAADVLRLLFTVIFFNQTLERFVLNIFLSPLYQIITFRQIVLGLSLVFAVSGCSLLPDRTFEYQKNSKQLNKKTYQAQTQTLLPTAFIADELPVFFLRQGTPISEPVVPKNSFVPSSSNQIWIYRSAKDFFSVGQDIFGQKAILVLQPAPTVLTILAQANIPLPTKFEQIEPPQASSNATGYVYVVYPNAVLLTGLSDILLANLQQAFTAFEKQSH